MLRGWVRESFSWFWSTRLAVTVRDGWEDAAISIRVPDITYLLVTMGVLEELSTAASLDGG